MRTPAPRLQDWQRSADLEVRKEEGKLHVSIRQDTSLRDSENLHSTWICTELEGEEGGAGSVAPNTSLAWHQIAAPAWFLLATRLITDDLSTADLVESSNVWFLSTLSPRCHDTRRFLTGATFLTTHSRVKFRPSSRVGVWKSADIKTMSGVSVKTTQKEAQCLKKSVKSHSTPGVKRKVGGWQRFKRTCHSTAAATYCKLLCLLGVHIENHQQD